MRDNHRNGHAQGALENGSEYQYRPSEGIVVGDSHILPISDPRPNYWMTSSHSGKFFYTPGGTYQPEKFPALERVFKEWEAS